MHSLMVADRLRYAADEMEEGCGEVESSEARREASTKTPVSAVSLLRVSAPRHSARYIAKGWGWDRAVLHPRPSKCRTVSPLCCALGNGRVVPPFRVTWHRLLGIG